MPRRKAKRVTNRLPFLIWMTGRGVAKKASQTVDHLRGASSFRRARRELERLRVIELAQRLCKSCQTEAPKNATFCPRCGSLQITTRRALAERVQAKARWMESEREKRQQQEREQREEEAKRRETATHSISIDVK